MPNDPNTVKAPAGEVKAIPINGMLIPDADSVRSMLWTLQERMKTDAQLAARYKAEPGVVLGSLGICRELQLEIMKAEGIEVPEGEPCYAVQKTCSWTHCMITQQW